MLALLFLVYSLVEWYIAKKRLKPLVKNGRFSF